MKGHFYGYIDGNKLLKKIEKLVCNIPEMYSAIKPIILDDLIEANKVIDRN